MREIKGFAAQRMDGRKAQQFPTLLTIRETTAATAGSYTATIDCWALIYAWGAGASGATGNSASGGGGGAAAYKRVRLLPGQTIGWSVGAAGAAQPANGSDGFDGGDTTITLPSSVVLTAGGGKKGRSGTATGGLGGECLGPWNTARRGGKGGNGASSSGGTAGESPQYGGVGGSGSGNFGGGGASAGFSDISPALPVGNGTPGASDQNLTTGRPGGASGGGPDFAGGRPAGAPGAVLVYVVATASN